MTPQQKKWLDENPKFEVVARGGAGQSVGDSPAGGYTTARYADVRVLMPDGTTRKGAPSDGGFSVGIKLLPGETIFNHRFSNPGYHR